MFLGKEKVCRVAEKREGREIFSCFSVVPQKTRSKRTLYAVILHARPPQATSEGIYGPLVAFNLYLSLLEWLKMSRYHSSDFLVTSATFVFAGFPPLTRVIDTGVRKKDAAFKETLHAGM